jgi:hypothetical protein
VLFLAGCKGRQDRPESADSRSGLQRSDTLRSATVQLSITNVHLPVLPDVVLQIRTLTGDMASTRSDTLVILDDQSSFEIHLRQAQAAISYEDLSRLLNEHVLAYRGAPIRDLEVTREVDRDHDAKAERIELKGHLAKLLGTPFEIEGVPEVTPEGKLRIRTKSIQALNVEVRGLLDFLDIESEDFLGELAERGIEFDGNDAILELDRLLPPPRIRGRLISVTMEPDRIAMELAGERTSAEARNTTTTSATANGDNDLDFRHGTIRLGRVTMHDAELRIVDLDPSDPFDFSFSGMNHQLAAGYAKLSEDGGLTAYAPDFPDIGSAKAGTGAPAGARMHP